MYLATMACLDLGKGNKSMKIKDANVKGLTLIQVNVSAIELLNGLMECFELKDMFYPDEDEYWKLEINENDKEVLRNYRDISHHGSCCFEKNYCITDTRKVEIYKYIRGIYDIIKGDKL